MSEPNEAEIELAHKVLNYLIHSARPLEVSLMEVAALLAAHRAPDAAELAKALKEIASAHYDEFDSYTRLERVRAIARAALAAYETKGG